MHLSILVSTTLLRERIVRGIYAPAQRLPSRAALGAEHGVGQATVQKALDALSRDGFVEARRRAGTFVADRPPHLSHYALVFGYRPNEPESWSGIAKALRDAAVRDGAQRGAAGVGVLPHRL
jgi:DNA-binding FadR family transcriptional regulator